MKALLAFAFVLFSAQVSATSMKAMECSAGQEGEDNYVSIVIVGDSIEFQMHETFLNANNTVTRRSGNTLAVLDQKLPAGSEGEEFVSTVNALLVYDPATAVLNATLIMDGQVVLNARELSCK